jgi:hypothetical protein
VCVVPTLGEKVDCRFGVLSLTSKARKKDKYGHIMAGAMVAGPVGAAAGALNGRFYGTSVQGEIQAKIRHLTIPQTPVKRKKYNVLGGISWDAVVDRYRERSDVVLAEDLPVQVEDSEHCFFVNHKETGACCALYRPLEIKLIVVSFHVTCAPIDLLTDTTIAQDVWEQGLQRSTDSQGAQWLSRFVGFDFPAPQRVGASCRWTGRSTVRL